MKLGVKVKLVLYETSEVRAEDAGLVGGEARTVVSDGWILAQGYTNADDLEPWVISMMLVDQKRRREQSPSERHLPDAGGPDCCKQDGTRQGNSRDHGRRPSGTL